jgi:hypothetical protein
MDIKSMSISFGDQFPPEFFGNLKKDVARTIDFSKAIEEGKCEINALIETADISVKGKQFCYACFNNACDEFFYMPTSSTGKYHGGQSDPSNCVGGNIMHTKEVLNMVPKVLNRYESALGVFYDELAECLRCACILHDICKYPSGSLYTSSSHGELGAEIIKLITADYAWKGLIAEAVAGHMYAWKFGTVFDFIRTFDGGSFNSLFLSFMLSECDYYSF